ncbi:hypothetical protein [Devosia sp. SL43]|uniref:hypothetical protein n=1 Tax=Devosia sp. SL43 TaxID=2806348 RepID=UPI001F302259|nr:hypothetical protein [Devosia sp. SL43]UJW84633.1 hypothetical protein IM737_14535 [Devosia sp. SL43]
MRFYRIAGLHRFALMLVAWPIVVGPAVATAAAFPQMDVETISGLALDLPEAFADGPSIIVIVYDQNQQPEADSWVPFLDEMTAARPEARYYVLPVLAAGLSMVRGMVEGIIRSTAKDPVQLDRTILLFTDVGALQEQLAIDGTSAVHVLVLDDVGEVVATASGAFSPINGQIVDDAFAALDGGEIGNPPGGEQEMDSLEQLR